MGGPEICEVCHSARPCSVPFRLKALATDPVLCGYVLSFEGPYSRLNGFTKVRVFGIWFSGIGSVVCRDAK